MQGLAAGGVTGDSLVPTWQESPSAALLLQGPGLGAHQECSY